MYFLILERALLKEEGIIFKKQAEGSIGSKECILLLGRT